MNCDEIVPDHLLTILDGYRCSQTLFTAVSLKLFDHLVEQELSLEELANQLDLPYLSSLERFLNGCIALKLLERNSSNKKYLNTPLSKKYLVSTSPHALNGYVHHNQQSSYLLWMRLSNAIRENGPQWQQTFHAVSESEFSFNVFYRSDDAEAVFMFGMHGLGLTCFPKIIECVDNFQQYKTLCDVGGATGILTVTACKASSHLEGIVFDLPRIEKYAMQYLSETAPDIRSRVRFQAGDFFVDPLPQADIYALGRILHDWNDDKCEIILKKIYETLPNMNGAILIAEKLLDEDKAGPIAANMQDLNMLVATTGRERSSSEYRHLLEKIGFKNIKCYRTGMYLDAIIGYK